MLTKKRPSFQLSLDDLLSSCQALIDTPIPTYRRSSSFAQIGAPVENMKSPSEMNEYDIEELCDRLVVQSLHDAFSIVKSFWCHNQIIKNFSSSLTSTSFRRSMSSCSFDSFDNISHESVLFYHSCCSSLSVSSEDRNEICGSSKVESLKNICLPNKYWLSTSKSNLTAEVDRVGTDINPLFNSCNNESSGMLNIFSIGSTLGKSPSLTQDSVESRHGANEGTWNFEKKETKMSVLSNDETRGEPIITEGHVSYLTRVHSNTHLGVTEQLPTLEQGENTYFYIKEGSEYSLNSHFIDDSVGKDGWLKLANKKQVVECNNVKVTREEYVSNKNYITYLHFPSLSEPYISSYLSNCGANDMMPGRKGKRHNKRKKNKRQSQQILLTDDPSSNDLNINIHKSTASEFPTDGSSARMGEIFLDENQRCLDSDHLASIPYADVDSEEYQFRSTVEHQIDKIICDNETRSDSNDIYRATPIFITDDDRLYIKSSDHILEKDVVSFDINPSSCDVAVDCSRLNKEYNDPVSVDHFRTSSQSSSRGLNSCQRLITIGNESTSFANEAFGIVESSKLFAIVCKFIVGQVFFFVDLKLSEFPLFSSVNDDLNKALDHLESYEWSLVTAHKFWSLDVDENDSIIVSYNMKRLIKNEGTESSSTNSDENSQFTSKLYGFTLVPDQNQYVKRLVPVFTETDRRIIFRDSKTSYTDKDRDPSSIILRPKKCKSFINRQSTDRHSASGDVQMYRNYNSLVPIRSEQSYIPTTRGGSILKFREVSLSSDRLYQVINEAPKAVHATDDEDKKIIESDISPSLIQCRSEIVVLQADQISDGFVTNPNETVKVCTANTSIHENKLKFVSLLPEIIKEDPICSQYEIDSEIDDAKEVSQNLRTSTINSNENDTSKISADDRTCPQELTKDALSFKIMSSDESNEIIADCSFLNFPHGNNEREISFSEINSHDDVETFSEEIIITVTAINSSSIVRENDFVNTANENISECSNAGLETLSTQSMINNCRLIPYNDSIDTIPIYISSRQMSPFSENKQIADIYIEPCSHSVNTTLSYKDERPIILASNCSVTNSLLNSSKMSVLPLSDISNSKSIRVISEKGDLIKEGNLCKENKQEDMEVEDLMIKTDSDSLSEEKTISKLLTSYAIQSKVLDFEKITQDMKCKHNPLNKSITDSSIIRKGSQNRGLIINTKAIDIARLQGAAPTRLIPTKFPMDIICHGRLNEMKKKTVPFDDVLKEENNESNYPQCSAIRSKSAGRMDRPKRKVLLTESKANSLDRSKRSNRTSRPKSEADSMNPKKTVTEFSPSTNNYAKDEIKVEITSQNVSLDSSELQTVTFTSADNNIPISVNTSSMTNTKEEIISPESSTHKRWDQASTKLDIILSTTSSTVNCTSSSCSLEAPIYSKVMLCKSSPLMREIKIDKVDRLSPIPKESVTAFKINGDEEKDIKQSIQCEVSKVCPFHLCSEEIINKEKFTEIENICSFVDHLLKPVFNISNIYPSILEVKQELLLNSHLIDRDESNITHDKFTSNFKENNTKLLEVSLPEPIKPISFIVEEVINLTDHFSVGESILESPSLVNEYSKKYQSEFIPILATLCNTESSATLVGELTPTPSPVPPCKAAEVIETDYSTNSNKIRTSVIDNFVLESFCSKPEVNEKSASMEDKKDFPEINLFTNNDKSELTEALIRLSYSSKSEEDGSVSSYDRPIDAEGMMASASASSTGSPLSWGSSQGPVARRDLLPLDEDYERTPSWQALLAVNRPDSDDEITGYESDDDFEDVDAEMQRLEEKLKKFELELELANSSSENYSSRDKNCSSKLVSKLRLRPEDIDILTTFSLPSVYPPMQINKTKHLSLILGNDSTIYSDSENSFTDSSIELNNLIYMKPTKKLKKGERRCRSLDLQCMNRKSYASSKNDLNLSILSDPLEVEDLDVKFRHNLSDSDKNISARVSPESNVIKLEQSLPSNNDLVKYDFQFRPNVPDHFKYSEQLYTGIIWVDPDSDITLFDFDGLDELNNVDNTDSLLFIFEDDDDMEDSIDYHSCMGVPCDSDLSLYHSTDSKIPQQSEIVLHNQSNNDYLKKKSGNLLSSFKNSFQKAAKYLGPMNFTRNNRDDERIYHCNEEKTFLELKATLLDQNDLLPSIVVKYDSDASHVPSARILNCDISKTNEERDLCSSGEFYAVPAVCSLSTSDDVEEQSTEDNPSSTILRKQDSKPHNLPSVPVNESISPDDVPTVQSNNYAAPPVPPPRTSSKEGKFEFSSGNDFITTKTLFELNNASNIDVINEASTPSKDAIENLTRNKSLRQLKRIQRERIEMQNTEELLEASGCNFCMGVALPRGRTNSAGNHSRQPSPHPKVLPDRRSWPPRI